MNKFVLGLLAIWALALPAMAEPGSCGDGHSNSPACRAPEIDGSLAIQFAALAGGLALLLKKKKR